MQPEGDYYATSPILVHRFINAVRQKYELGKILEPACGGGHISKVLENYSYIVESSDLYNHGFGQVGIDFLNRTEKFNGSIITNPPYSLSREFIMKALEIQTGGGIIAMLLPLQWTTAKKNYIFYDNISDVYDLLGRVGCGKNGDFSKNTRAINYAWVVFQRNFKGIKEFHII